MKLQAMKFYDKYVGWLGCAGLTLWEKFARLAGISKKINQGKKSIAVMKFWGMGSIILATPLVRALKNKFPSAKLYFITLARNKSLIESLKIADGIITLEVDGGWLRFTVSFFKMIFTLRKTHLDAVCDLEFFTRFSALVSYLSGAPLRAGYHSFSVWRGDLHNVKVPFNRYWHVSDNFYNIGYALGLSEKEDKMPALVYPEYTSQDEEYVNDLLNSAGVFPDGKKAVSDLIIMHANASDLALERRWPYNYFADLAGMIIREKKDIAGIVFIGTREENFSVEEIRRLINDKDVSRRIFNLCGQLNIRQLSYLMKLASFGVFNDSGPLHLAVACRLKTVSLFGPETPVIYGPRSGDSDTHIVFFKNLDCSPCVNVHDGKTVKCSRYAPECLKEITPGEVFEAIKTKGWI